MIIDIDNDAFRRKLALYLEQYELINQELAAQVIDLQTKIKAT